MYANEFAKRKWQVTITYPIVENPSFYYFKYSFVPKNLINFFVLCWNKLKKNQNKKFFLGLNTTCLCQMVGVKSYYFKPKNEDFPQASFLVIFQSYLLPFLEKLETCKGTKIDCVAGSNYENDRSTFGRFWLFNCHRLYPKYQNTKRFALSYDSAIYHRRKGIPIHQIIPNGVDMSNFKPSPLAKKQFSLLMFCDSKPAKGFLDGVEIIRAIS